MPIQNGSKHQLARTIGQTVSLFSVASAKTKSLGRVDRQTAWQRGPKVQAQSFGTRAT